MWGDEEPSRGRGRSAVGHRERDRHDYDSRRRRERSRSSSRSRRLSMDSRRGLRKGEDTREPLPRRSRAEAPEYPPPLPSDQPEGGVGRSWEGPIPAARRFYPGVIKPEVPVEAFRKPADVPLLGGSEVAEEAKAEVPESHLFGKKAPVPQFEPPVAEPPPPPRSQRARGDLRRTRRRKRRTWRPSPPRPWNCTRSYGSEDRIWRSEGS